MSFPIDNVALFFFLFYKGMYLFASCQEATSCVYLL